MTPKVKWLLCAGNLQLLQDDSDCSKNPEAEPPADHADSIFIQSSGFGIAEHQAVASSILTVSSWREPKIQAPILQAEKRKFKVAIITIPCPYLSGTMDSGNKVLCWRSQK